MSIFKDKAVVLKIDKIREKDLLYTIFTYEYWKIRANKKFSNKEKNIDLWNVINFEIHTKENVKIHKIKNIKIKSSFDLKEKNFEIINLYLEILALINREIWDWLQHKEIFEVLEHINNYEKIDKIKLINSYLKINFLLWNIWTENNDEIIEKILKFINNNHIKEIFRLSGINDNLEQKLLEIKNNIQ